jgi:hypothetical protein
MTEPDPGRPEQDDPWGNAVAELRAFLGGAVAALESDYPTTLERLRQGLYGGYRTETLHLLRFLDDEFTIALLNELVAFSLSERDGMLVRENLGRLPYSDAERLVPFAVWRLLEEQNDAFAYMRLAHLLDHLGLDEAGRELVRRALASDDPEVRQVAADDFL